MATPPTVVIPTVNIKLPAFWTKAPAAYFQHIQSLFRRKQISSSLDKFDLVIEALNEQESLSIQPWLETLSQVDDTEFEFYQALKDQLFLDK